MPDVGSLSPSGGRFSGAKFKAILGKKYLGLKGLYWLLIVAVLFAFLAFRMKPAADDSTAAAGSGEKFDAAGNPLPTGLYNPPTTTASGVTGGGGGLGGGLTGSGGELSTSPGGGTSVAAPVESAPYSPIAVEEPAQVAEELPPIELVDPVPVAEQTDADYMSQAIMKYTARGYTESQVRGALGAYLSGRDMNLSQTLLVQKALREMGTPSNAPAKVGKFATVQPTVKATTSKPAVMTPHQTHVANVAAKLASGALNTTAAKNLYGAAVVHEAKTNYPAASAASAKVVARPAAPVPTRTVKTASPIATAKTVAAPKVAAPTAHQVHVANVANQLASGRINVTAAVAKYGRAQVTAAQAQIAAKKRK